MTAYCLKNHRYLSSTGFGAVRSAEQLKRVQNFVLILKRKTKTKDRISMTHLGIGTANLSWFCHVDKYALE